MFCFRSSVVTVVVVVVGLVRPLASWIVDVVCDDVGSTPSWTVFISG